MITKEQATAGTRVKIPTKKTVGRAFDDGDNSLVGYAKYYRTPVIIKKIVEWDDCVMLGLQGNEWKDGDYYALADLEMYH